MPKKPSPKKPESKNHLKLPTKRYLYEEANMQNAIKAAKDGMSIRSAAIKYNIPRTTLSDKLSGRSPLVRKIGRGTVLSEEEEESVVEWVMKCNRRGFALHRDYILDSIQSMINAGGPGRTTPFINNRPGRKWLQLFLNRHPILNKKSKDPECKRSKALEYKKSKDQESIIRTWFGQLKEQLDEMDASNVIEDRTRVFCLDEANIQLCPKTGKVMGFKNWKNIHEVAPGPDKSTMSIIITYRADGEISCPGLIYPYPRISPDMANSVPKGYYVGCSESGWVRPETLQEYLEEGFIPWLTDNGVTLPVILFVIGQTTHVTLQVSDFCEKHGIILSFLPPHTENILHPGRVGTIDPLKTLWKEAVASYQAENPNSIVRRGDVVKVLGFLLDRIDRLLLFNGFILSGLCPLDPDRVDYSKVVHAVKPEEPPPKSPDEGSNVSTTHVLPYNSNYQIAKTVMMELVPKNRLSLAMKNKGDKGLADLWTKINEKIESEIKIESVCEPSTEVYSSTVINEPVDEDTEEVVVSIDAETMSSETEDAQYTYVIWQG